VEVLVGLDCETAVGSFDDVLGGSVGPGGGRGRSIPFRGARFGGN
jgi:hypothetical protein